MIRLFICLCCLLVAGISSCGTHTEGQAQSTEGQCAHCGMPTANYANWKTEALFGKEWKQFCSPRCTFVYAHKKGLKHDSIVVSDFYNLEKTDGKRCTYIIGSDVLGPMGHDLVPVHGPEAADGFMIEHLGKEMLPYDSISSATLEKLKQY